MARAVEARREMLVMKRILMVVEERRLEIRVVVRRLKMDD
jgi:hypothetical protein